SRLHRGEIGRCRSVFSRHFVVRHVQKLCRSRRSISRPCPCSPENEMKIFDKLPKFSVLKRKRKKMRATVARRPLRAATADYEEMAEPNMKLSRALLIVLLLHVVAVSGIIAFNAIKTRQGPSLPRIKSISAHGAKSETSATSSSAGETG